MEDICISNKHSR